MHAEDEPHETKPILTARLAAHLLGPMPDGGHGEERIEAAVRSAAALLAKAAASRQQHVWELFTADPLISVKDIAAVLAEKDWPKLKSQNTVSDRVLEILDLIHADIQTRRALVATAFESNLPERARLDGSASAKLTIRALLRTLGMDVTFGPGIDEAVKRIWNVIVEIWLQADADLRTTTAQLRQSSETPATPEFFSEICVEHGYDGYVRSLLPPEGFGIEAILDLSMWADICLKPQLLEECDKGATGDSEGQAAQTLRKLNSWLVPFFPEMPAFASPFGKCLVAMELYRSSEDRVSKDAIEQGLSGGVSVMAKAWAALRLRDLVGTLPLTNELELLRCMYHAVANCDPESKSRLSIEWERDYDVLGIISSVTAAMEGRFATRFPIDGPFPGQCASPYLRPYAKLLASFSRCLELLDEVLAFFARRNATDEIREAGGEGVDDHGSEAIGTQGTGNLQMVRAAVTQECLAIDSLGTSLTAEDSEDRNKRIESGAAWAEKSKARFTPGLIRPLRLFQYAHRRGWKPDLFSR